jgi:Acyl-CoA carboxylase epsilon subunit
VANTVTEAEPAPQAPVVTVTRGEPTPAELAAVLAVLYAVAAGRATSAPAAARPRSAWTEHSRVRRTLPPPGPGAWRASAWA